jgi:hypothetical protein
MDKARQAQEQAEMRLIAHPTWYNEPFDLQKPATWGAPDETVQIPYTSKKGNGYTLVIEGWHNLLMRGKHDLPMHNQPFTLVRVRLLDAEGKSVFHDMWLIVAGKRRKCRCWRLGKPISNATMLSTFSALASSDCCWFQTPEAEREENWMQFVKLSYTQLWLMRDLADNLPRPWEKYLQAKEGQVSPSRALRDAERIIRAIGAPAQAPKPRGKSPGRSGAAASGEKGSESTRPEPAPILQFSKSIPLLGLRRVFWGCSKSNQFTSA